MATVDEHEVLVQLRKKHAIPDNGKPPPVKSTVGIVLSTVMISGLHVTFASPGRSLTGTSARLGHDSCGALYAQVGLVLDGTSVTMIVPGGPAYKPTNGKKIDKTDSVLAIDPDGKSGFKAVTPANVISLLRGPDKVGSTVKLQIASSTSKETNDFALKRADFRAVEKIKDGVSRHTERTCCRCDPKPGPSPSYDLPDSRSYRR
jgi:hypothetical protein